MACPRSVLNKIYYMFEKKGNVMTDLFSPVKMGDIELNNRILMAPLTRNRAHNDTDIPHDLGVEYYAQRASSGLIITEATQISAEGKGYISTPGIYTEKQVEKWREIVQAVHDKGGKIFLQLWHVGRISHESVLPEGQKPLAPSAVRADAQTYTKDGPTDVSEPKAMSIQDIERTLDDYKKAAENAKKAGFDGVEVHGANGYLIDQFTRDHSNKRDDKYGGSVENRSRFLFEVLDRVISVWGAERVGLRLSPTGTFNDMGDSDPLQTFGYIIDQLNNYNLSYLHMVERFPGIENSNEDFAILEQLYNRWQGFYIANGDYDYMKAKDAVEGGHAHAITFGRPFIANPDLPERLKRGAPLNEPDHDTFYGGGAKGYVDYPFLDETKAA